MPTEAEIQNDVDPRDSMPFMGLLDRNISIIYEGKFFHQFSNIWGNRPRYLIRHDSFGNKVWALADARYFRAAFRQVASSTNERTAIFGILPPGAVAVETAPIEKEPWTRTNTAILAILGVTNSFTFDWTVRFRAAAHVNLFLLNHSPIPCRLPNSILARCVLRLVTSSDLYAPLWAEQLGDVWREPKPKHAWPVLEGDDARWAVRAVIDAVVAEAYGLDRDQYAYVLSTFSHRSYPMAPELCLAAFDELKALGLEAFIQKHDPYWDIPLNESLPQPVIDLPIPGQEASASEDFGPMFSGLQVVSAPAPAPRPAPIPMTPRPPRAESSPAYDTLKALLQERGDISSGDAQEATCLDAAGVRPLLRRLVDEGLAETEGQRRGMRYRRRGGN
jgi:hypothetical protein